MCGIEGINQVLSDMDHSRVDYLGYSWFGEGRFTEEFLNIKKNESKTLYHLDYDKKINKIRQKNSLRIRGNKSVIISLPAIFSRSFFNHLIHINRPLLRRWPKNTPFDLEKRWNDTYMLPVKYAMPKFELFASIDDDNQDPGSSLISRGLYKNRISREELLSIREKEEKKINNTNLRKLIKKIPFISPVLRFAKRLSFHF